MSIEAVALNDVLKRTYPQTAVGPIRPTVPDPNAPGATVGYFGRRCETCGKKVATAYGMRMHLRTQHAVQ